MATTNPAAGRDRSFTPPASFIPSTFLGLVLRNRRQTKGSRSAGGPVRLLLSPVRWLRALVLRRRIERQLSALSDHLLADIGITRGNIPHVARAAARMETNPLRAKGRPTWAARADFSARVRSLYALNGPEFRHAA